MNPFVLSIRRGLFPLLLFLATAGTAQDRPNVLLICIDDLRPELASFGADYIVSPNIDGLAASGRAFQRHYVNAPSCGPSRHTLLTGRYGPSPNTAIFERAAALKRGGNTIPPTLPEWFRGRGYRTVSIGKVSHHPGGYGGEDWNDSTDIEMPGAWDASLMPADEWQHPRGAMHALANGEARPRELQTMPPIQALVGSDSIYQDGRITGAALQQLEELSGREEPFFLAVGLIKPHLPFGAPRRYLDLYADVELPVVANPERPGEPSTWHESFELHQYKLAADPLTDTDYATQLRKHYAACVSYADTNVGKILAKLRRTGADENTIIVLWGDHGWNLGNHAIWGKHNLFEEGLHSPLIIRYPGMAQPGVDSDAVVETADLFPTLCELAGLPVPDFVHGRSLTEALNEANTGGGSAVGYYQGAATIRTDRYRLITHGGGGVELYDHVRDPYEQTNVADEQPDVVSELSRLLAERMAGRVSSYD